VVGVVHKRRSRGVAPRQVSDTAVDRTENNAIVLGCDKHGTRGVMPRRVSDRITAEQKIMPLCWVVTNMGPMET